MWEAPPTRPSLLLYISILIWQVKGNSNPTPKHHFGVKFGVKFTPTQHQIGVKLTPNELVDTKFGVKYWFGATFTPNLEFSKIPTIPSHMLMKTKLFHLCPIKVVLCYIIYSLIIIVLNFLSLLFYSSFLFISKYQ